jgi:phosphoribosylanthranilate isomerase
MTKVKVCGLTREQDVRLCCEMKVDFMGFIFHEPSPRNVDPEFAARAHCPTAAKVGVFVRQTPAQIRKIMDRCHLDYAQLHGDQTPEDCREVGSDRVIKTLWPERCVSTQSLQMEIGRYAEACAYLLFDAGSSGGGHGRSIDFTYFQHIEIKKNWFLAGGLTPDNVGLALQQNPTVLDINSGVESAPGIKDATKLRAAMNRIADHKGC